MSLIELHHFYDMISQPKTLAEYKKMQKNEYKQSTRFPMRERLQSYHKQRNRSILEYDWTVGHTTQLQ